MNPSGKEFIFVDPDLPYYAINWISTKNKSIDNFFILK